MANKEDRVIFAARDYTEYRRPDGSTYVEHHKQEPRRRHGERSAALPKR
jgi:hypothetical protein